MNSRIDPTSFSGSPALGGAAELFAAPAEGHYDELRDPATGALRDAWAKFFSHVDLDGAADLNRRDQSLARQIRDNGVSYNVVGDGGALRRPWSVDLFPMLIDQQSWAQIETGVLQRTRLLNALMQDVYGDQSLIHRGLLPAALIHGHPSYQRAMLGVRPLGDTWLNLAAFDLARGPDGGWSIVSQYTQAPSGLGYLLENRMAIARQFPAAFSFLRVRRLADSYRRLVSGIRSMAPGGENARIAVLTPGPYNETYFEHAFLARYLGLVLVEGSDLTVRGQRLFIKTLRGLEPVDALIKRLDDEWLDPLELRPDSQLGVPGLLQAVRAGNLLLVNPPGSGPIESSALLGFLPPICRDLLGEELALPAIDTWWCGESGVLETSLTDLDRYVVKPTHPRAGRLPMLPQAMQADEHAELRRRLCEQPMDYTLQAYLPLSQTPSWSGRQIAPRAAMLRVYVYSDGPQTWRVLPGGLVRLTPRGQRMMSMQGGGSSADCWVLGEVDDVDDQLRLSDTAPSSVALVTEKPAITSRAAENLFWLGRYTERSEHDVRLAQVVLRVLHGERRSESALQQWVSELAHSDGLVRLDVPSIPGADATAGQALRLFERALIAGLGDVDQPAGVANTLRRLSLASAEVRERLTHEQRAMIERAEVDFVNRCGDFTVDADSAAQEALNALESLSEVLAGITGAQVDRMVRDDGWRMLSLGRLIERLAGLTRSMQSALTSGSLKESDGFDALIALFHSTIHFRAQYQHRRNLTTLADLLVIDADNPRSLAGIIGTIRARLSRLESHNEAARNRLLELLPDPRAWRLETLLQTPDRKTYPTLMRLLDDAGSAAYQLSDALGERYFSHADRASHSVSAP